MVKDPAGDRQPPRPASLTVVTTELELLGFEPQTRTDSGAATAWTAADSSITVTITTGGPGRICLSDHDPHHTGDPRWTVVVDARTPAHVCLMALYAAVNAHDAAAAVRAVTEALAPPGPHRNATS